MNKTHILVTTAALLALMTSLASITPLRAQTPDFNIAAAPLDICVSPGEAASYLVTVSSTDGFQGKRESDQRSECYVQPNRIHGTGYPRTGLHHYDNRRDRCYCTLCDSLSDSPTRMRICRRLPCTREQYWPTGTLRYHRCNCCRRRRGNSNTTQQQTNQSPMMIAKQLSNSSSFS